MNIDKVDKIILTDKQYVDIGNWVREQNFDSCDFPLKEVFVILKDIQFEQIKQKLDTGVYFHLDEKTQKLTVKQYDMSDMFLMFSATLDDEFFTTGKTRIDQQSKYSRMMPDEHMQKTAMISIGIVLDVFQYMTKQPKTVIESANIKSIRKPQRNKKKSNTNKSRYVKVKTMQYTFDLNPNPRQYDRHINSWTVRGHWRYYKKTGNRVWINGYTKGTGETQGKIYKI